jgi:arginyl-tRNA synthetase
MSNSSTNIFAVVLNKVRAANQALVAAGALPTDIDQSRIVVEPPRDAAHGDMATNAAMVLAKDAAKKPRELAELIAARLRTDDLIAKVDVAGPGFINMTLKPAAWIEALRAVLHAGSDYGRSAVGQGARVNVEYVSANPTDWPDACRPLPRRRVRRRPRQSVGCRGLRGDARILHQ